MRARSEAEQFLEVLPDGDHVVTFVGLLLLLILMLAPIHDILNGPRRHGLPRGSVEVFWALGAMFFFPIGGLAWWIGGRSIRRRELREAAVQQALAKESVG